MAFLLCGSYCAAVSISSVKQFMTLQHRHHTYSTGVLRSEDVRSRPPCECLHDSWAHSLPPAPSCPLRRGRLNQVLEDECLELLEREQHCRERGQHVRWPRDSRGLVMIRERFAGLEQ